MNIREMHELFRLLGQQMGMERIRVILPQSIDGYIDNAIDDTISLILKDNLQYVSRRQIVLTNFTSPINALSTLYKEQVINVNTNEKKGDITVSAEINDVLYLYAFSLKYKDDERFFNCRIIEPDRLELTFNDFCNRASYRYPIINIPFTGKVEKDYTFELYTDRNAIINSLKVKYLKVPNKVHFDEDNFGKENDTSVDCDLPVHLHHRIVELAVQKYFESVGSTTHSNKQ